MLRLSVVKGAWNRSKLTVGAVLGALSFSKLMSTALERGWPYVLQTIFEKYDDVVQFVLGIFEKPVGWFAQAIADWTGLALPVIPEWKHIFIVFMLYVVRDVDVDFRRARIADAWFSLFLGTSCALVAGLGAGAASVNSESGGYLLVAFFCSAMFIYEFLRSIWRAVRRHKRNAPLDQTLVGSFLFLTKVILLPVVAISVGVLFLPAILPRDVLVTASGEAMATLQLVAFIAAYAIYLVVWGAIVGWRHSSATQTWSHGFLQSGATQVGVLMLVPMIIAVALVSLAAF